LKKEKFIINQPAMRRRTQALYSSGDHHFPENEQILMIYECCAKFLFSMIFKGIGEAT